MAAPVPAVCEIDEVTAAWLSRALGRPEKLVEVTATRFGTGQLGGNLRYELTWRGDLVDGGPVAGDRPSWQRRPGRRAVAARRKPDGIARRRALFDAVWPGRGIRRLTPSG